METKTSTGVMYWLWAIGLAAFGVLGAAAVWLGGLNQDEGWYLYAAQLVSEGNVLYRDFFYTQGPLMPMVYSFFVRVWQEWGLLGARVMTLLIGFIGVMFAAALAGRLVPTGRKLAAAVSAFLMLGCNLYHIYYTAIPKTYALASLFVMMGFYLLSFSVDARHWLSILAGLSLAFAAGTRVSLGALLVVVGISLLVTKRWKSLAWFCVGGFAGLAIVYGPFLLDDGTRSGLVAAQRYHAARGGSDPVWVIGSLSRLVRWYLPVFVVLGLGFVGMRRCLVGSRCLTVMQTVSLLGFLAVFMVQMVAPFPYEDYQVPVMGLLVVFATAWWFSGDNSVVDLTKCVILVMGMTFACSFGSPLLEKWMTNGQDRFWSIKKKCCELSQLRMVADQIEQMDPGGKDLLTQDLYLAIETRRRVPKGLEMGPFSMLSDSEWRQLLGNAQCRVAALSGYSFAIVPPKCDERPTSVQMEYWNILKNNYKLVVKEENFGQNATTLLVLRRK